MDDVAEAVGAQQGCLRPVPLDDRIGRDGLPVYEKIDPVQEFPEWNTCLLGQSADTALNGLGWAPRRGAFLPQRYYAVAVDQREIGEGAAEVDAQHVLHAKLPFQRVLIASRVALRL